MRVSEWLGGHVTHTPRSRHTLEVTSHPFVCARRAKHNTHLFRAIVEEQAWVHPALSCPRNASPSVPELHPAWTRLIVSGRRFSRTKHDFSAICPGAAVSVFEVASVSTFEAKSAPPPREEVSFICTHNRQSQHPAFMTLRNTKTG